MAIKSPFNFVPVSDKVFFPDWASQISQDVPFRDGLSGTIDLKITAETPIFIRNGHTKKDVEVENEEYDSFSFVRDAAGNKRYFIPATSIKGEVRSVLETFSFGKLHVDPAARWARRDLNDSDNYPLIKNQKAIHCGWLKSDGESYTVKDCGRPLYIEHDDIDTFLKDHIFERAFKADKAGVGQLKENQKTAQYKYNLLKDRGFDEQCLHNLSFDFVRVRGNGSDAVRYSTRGSIEGTIVLTGQPSKWDKRSLGKHYEFVFEDHNAATTYEYSERELKELRFIYDQDKEQKQWKWLQGRINSEYGAPVFFRLDGKTIKDLGFAYLYKLPYEKSIEKCLSREHRDNSKPDLAECIFGYSYGQNSLKGRVHFGNAFAEGDVMVLSPVKLILASPKASYYPEYIKQSGGGYKTYDNGELAGRKRYYLRDKLWEKSAIVKDVDTQNTTIYPLDKGTEFGSLISFHNLRPEELGALLAALTFAGGKTNRHQLGMAKPYGYGKCRYDVKLSVEPSPIEQEAPNNDIGYYVALFELKMDEWFLGSKWISMREVKELLALSSKSCDDADAFKYMRLEMSGVNEFVDAKKKKEYLHPASELLNGSSFSRDAAIDKYKEDIKKELADKAAEQQAAAATARKKKLDECESRIANCETDKEVDDINNELKDLKNTLGNFPEEQSRISNLLLDVLRKKNEIQNAQQAADSARKPFLEVFPKATSFGQWEGKIKTRKELSKEDRDWAFEKLKEVYYGKTFDSRKMVQKDKKWSDGSYLKSCARLVGQELAEQWFNELLG